MYHRDLRADELRRRQEEILLDMRPLFFAKKPEAAHHAQHLLERDDEDGLSQALGHHLAAPGMPAMHGIVPVMVGIKKDDPADIFGIGGVLRREVGQNGGALEIAHDRPMHRLAPGPVKIAAGEIPVAERALMVVGFAKGEAQAHGTVRAKVVVRPFALLERRQGRALPQDIGKVLPDLAQAGPRPIILLRLFADRGPIDRVAGQHPASHPFRKIKAACLRRYQAHPPPPGGYRRARGRRIKGEKNGFIG